MDMFKNEERILKNVLNLKVNRKCPRGGSRSRWEQQVRKPVTQEEGRTWEETEKLWEDTDSWRGLVVR
jgi:hypothetical protein